MRFGLLGSVEVQAAGAAVPLDRPRYRAVLAYLLLYGGQLVSIDQLARALWEDPPASARTQIHIAVSRLRRILGEHDLGDVIMTKPGGYRLTTGDDDLDVEVFRREVAAVRTRRHDPAEAAQRLRRALDLWRGPALTGVSAPFAAAARRRLHEQRLAASELLAGAELALGRHDTVIEDLLALTAEHPCREPLVCQLMLAQYRAGQRAEALATARWTRAALVEQHGLDPGRDFVELEQAILAADPRLDPVPLAA